MGFFDVFKKSKKEIIRENQSQGKIGEEKIKTKYEFSGYKVKRTGKGSDFKAERKNWLTGEKETKIIEVKTGSSRLSKLQKKKKRQHGRKYIVERLERTPLGLMSNDNMFGTANSIKKRKAVKKSSGCDSLFGSSGGSKTKRTQSSGYNSLFGSSGSSGRRKKSFGL